MFNRRDRTFFSHTLTICLSNSALVSAADVSAQVSAAVFSALVSPADSGAPKGFDLLINGMWPVRAEMHSEIQPGQIAVTAHQRSRMDLGTIKNNTVTAEFYQPRHPDPPIGIVKAALSFANINQVTSKEIDEDELVKKFLPVWKTKPFSFAVILPLHLSLMPGFSILIPIC